MHLPQKPWNHILTTYPFLNLLKSLVRASKTLEQFGLNVFAFWLGLKHPSRIESLLIASSTNRSPNIPLDSSHHQEESMWYIGFTICFHFYNSTTRVTSQISTVYINQAMKGLMESKMKLNIVQVNMWMCFCYCHNIKN